MSLSGRTVEAALLGRFPAPVRIAGIAELAGDASTRRYYRVTLAPGSPVPSVVAMRYPDEVPPGEELPFVNVHRYFRKASVPVPEILASVPGEKLLVLSDLGDTMLETAVRDASSPDEAIPLYERSVEILVRIQWDGTRALDAGALPARLSFDLAKFAGEIDFFFRHAVREYGGIPLSEEEERRIEDAFLPFLERLVSLPRVLAHRDYHSRNLMVREAPAGGTRPDLFVLDFQDARMGNVFYDLCSLFRDSYVTVPEKAVEHLSYAWRHAAPAGLLRDAGDPKAFGFLLDLAALQRNVKAIGTFGNQVANRGKGLYRKFIPPTVAHLIRNMDRNPEMRALSDRLLPILVALAEKAEREEPPCGP